MGSGGERRYGMGLIVPRKKTRLRRVFQGSGMTWRNRAAHQAQRTERRKTRGDGGPGRRNGLDSGPAANAGHVLLLFLGLGEEGEREGQGELDAEVK